MTAPVGEIIATRRKALGMSVAALAKKIGKSRATVYRYETGLIEKVPANVIPLLAKALQMPTDELMGVEEEPVKSEEKIFLQKYDELPLADKIRVRVVVDRLHNNSRKVWQPRLTARDMREVERDAAVAKSAVVARLGKVKNIAELDNAIKGVLVKEKLRAKKTYTPIKFRGH